MEECIFCDREKIKEDILSETGNFFTKVGFGIVAPGHIMMISNEHYPCYGDLPNKLEGEYEESKNVLQKQIADKFATPFLVERGIWGQTVPHAHTHFIPSKGQGYEVKSILEEMVKPGGINFEEVDRKKLKEIYKSEGGYVSIEERGILYVCHVTGIQSDKYNPHPHLNYRAFFTQRKGLKGIISWEKMSKEDKKRDEEKRNLTKKILTDFI